jgi:hypothetical protein
MQVIDLETEQPTEKDFYFVIGKKNTKAVLYWNGEEFELDNVAHNYFTKDRIQWVKMK